MSGKISRGEADKLVGDFGNLLLKEEFETASKFMSSHARRQFSPSRLASAYGSQTSGFTPHHLNLSHGPLPSSDQETHEMYGLPDDIPLSSCLAWMFINFMSEDEEKATELRVMIIDEDGEPKIGYLQFFDYRGVIS